MEKTYNPQAIEQNWYKQWEKNNYFSPQTSAEDAKPYCIMIPPPNVTGSLHMGHAFQDTIMDALTRFHRMRGDNTLWQAGSDHAGIATQMVVERQLASEGKNRHDLGRDKFIEKIWQWKEQSGNTITQQLRRMGSSLDWQNERFTMDEGLSTSVSEVFVQLFEEGLIYRGKRLVNWDPVLHTAVSDLEVISEEEAGHMWHMRYPLSSGDGQLVVATTRPETMLGDAAVAVHPDDTRYSHLVGQWVKLPLTEREIPIIADDYVDPEFGTGCVKITPAHDFNDYDVWKRHSDKAVFNDIPNRGLINIFDNNACIDNELPPPFRGLERFEARKLVVTSLQEQGLLVKIDDHKLMVPRGDRSGSVIEPYLTDQWYVKIAPLAEPAIKAVEDGDIKFVPDNWKNTYFEWMRNIQDWCISRQIWWGHRIPAWYDDEGNYYVGRNEDEVRKKYALGDMPLQQDEDVLDTWFSSALWPFSTLGWPEKTDKLETFYPTSVLVTGFDIIFFWVARMIMMGLKFTGKIPFKEVYIHGLVRDSHGQKMSKSKGNVLDPIDLIDGISLEELVAKRKTGLMQPKMAKKIEKATRKDFPDGINAYGTDALRFTFAAMASTGRDINFDLGRIDGYRNFCNKLWNAARYVTMNTENTAITTPNSSSLLLADRWITSRFQSTTAQVTNHLTTYRLDLAAQVLYEFIWNTYCDWYLELIKPVLLGDSGTKEEKNACLHTMVTILEAVLRLTHPIMPFITEEIWQRIAPLINKHNDTIMLEPYPTADHALISDACEDEMEWVMNFISAIRKIRSGMNIAPGKMLPVFLQQGDKTDRSRIQHHTQSLITLAKLSDIKWLSDSDEAPESATALVGKMELLIPMAGLINKAEEIARLNKEILRLEKDYQRTNGKLQNPSFVDKAPAIVVDKEKEKLASINNALSKFQVQLKKIESL